MRNRVALSALLTGLAFFFTASYAHAQAREEGRLLMATQVLEEIRSSRDQFIPDRLLDRAYGIVVVPSVTKVAFIAGGRWGKGAMVVRDKNGNFTSPVFINLAGASIGWQWGGQSTDIVLVFTTRKGIEGITGGKLTLGADASVAAGPVGRSASAATDQNFAAEVYSYSRSRGLFAGIALDGTSISVDSKANAAYYRKPGVMASDILNGTVTTTDDTARRFLAAVATSTSPMPAAGSSTTPPASASTSTSSPSGTAVSEAPAGGPHAPASTEARTFPMEDPKPGAEPK
ncbi:MAG TPA: lipid-binding SYLF domain-containing protein [Steroidobacteraceae bacterium]|nr:lipid-binding SYLF domain-containing protein [Steroidobacteraceae bacterium]